MGRVRPLHGRVVDEDRHSLTLRPAGTFTPTEELYHEAEKAQELNEQLFERTRAAGAIPPDLTVNDLSFLFEQLAAVRGGRIGGLAGIIAVWIGIVLVNVAYRRR